MNRRPNNRDRVPLPSRTPGLGDDVPCSKCGAVALDTGLECDACGHDMAPELESPPAVVPAAPSDAVPCANCTDHQQCAAYTRGVQSGRRVALSQTMQPKAERDAKTWCAYIADIIETYLNSNPAPEVREKAIAGIIERRLWALPSATPPAVMPAVPSDAVAAVRALVCDYADAFNARCEAEGPQRATFRTKQTAIMAEIESLIATLAQPAPVAAPAPAASEGNYPPLPTRRMRNLDDEFEDLTPMTFTADEMRAYVDTDRAARAASPSTPEPAPASEAVADLRDALAFMDQMREAAKNGEEVTATGVARDAREWLERAARDVTAPPQAGAGKDGAR